MCVYVCVCMRVPSWLSVCSVRNPKVRATDPLQLLGAPMIDRWIYIAPRGWRAHPGKHAPGINYAGRPFNCRQLLWLGSHRAKQSPLGTAPSTSAPCPRTDSCRLQWGVNGQANRLANIVKAVNSTENGPWETYPQTQGFIDTRHPSVAPSTRTVCGALFEDSTAEQCTRKDRDPNASVSTGLPRAGPHHIST